MLKERLDRRSFIRRSLVYSIGGIGLSSGLSYIPTHSINMKKLPGGFWPVMMTPFKNDMSIDYRGLKRMIRWYEDAGSGGLFANCASSEMYQLSPQERIDLTKFVVDNTHLPVVSSGTFVGKPNDDADFIKQIYNTGVEAVVLIPSILVPKEADETRLMKAFEEVIKSTGNVPLGIYECPGPYKRLIPLEILDKLQDTGRFLYFKDTSCDASVVDQRINVVESSSLGIYNAHSPDALHSIRHGGAGISSIAGNFYPELFSYLWKKGRKKKITKSVREVNDFILANDPVIGNKYPVAAKYFMNLRGLDIQVNSRKFSTALEQSDKDKLDFLWKNLIDLTDKYKIDLVTYT